MSEEYKDKIKIAVTKLKTKVDKLEVYYKSNKVDGDEWWLKEQIELANKLCKLVVDLSDQDDFYQITPAYKDYNKDDLYKDLLSFLGSAEILWYPKKEKISNASDIDLDKTLFIFCKYEGSEIYANINLDLVSKYNELDLGTDILEVSGVDDHLEFSKISKIELNNNTFLGGDGQAECFIVKDMINAGIRVGDISLFGFNGSSKVKHLMDEFEDIAGELAEYSDADIEDFQFFGHPTPCQDSWIYFYKKGYRILLSIGDDMGSGQIMYKKENGKINFSFDWAPYG
jgi:hypothetical protein